MYVNPILRSLVLSFAIIGGLFASTNLQGLSGYPCPINKCITAEEDLMPILHSPLYHNINKAIQTQAIKCVVIDPGHGGKDGGCHGHHALEKDISLEISKKLKTVLNKHYPDLKVVLTRDRDVFIPLHKRAKIANDLHADLFISIHCNSAPKNKNAKGTETFVLGLHRAEDNLNVAKRENESILLEDNYQRFYGGFDPNSPSTHILMSMFQNAYLDQSIRFADLIEQQSTSQYRRRTRGVKQAGFAVLRLTTMPSVLFEMGFLSNNEDANYLKSNVGQDNIANQLFKAIEVYQDQINKQKSSIERNPLALPKMDHTATTDRPSKPYYSVQLASTATSLERRPKGWKTLNEVYSVKIGNRYKYVFGKFTDKASAKDQLTHLRQQGIKDAFVVNHPNQAELAF